MFALSETFGLSVSQKQSGTFAIRLLILLIICVFSLPAEAETSIYLFVPGQSSVVQTGGFAGVDETYGIEGKFRLTVDSDAGIASFDEVDANLTEPTGFLYSQSLGEIFNMTALTGTVIDDTTIEFEGKTADGTESDVSLSLEDDSVQLTGKTTPPPNSADMFLYELDAIATKKYAGGSGEPDNPYLIYTAEQMNSIGVNPDDWDKHFKLMADIDLSAYTGTDFNIIGVSFDDAFTGVFDGNGHTISNFNYTSASLDYVGLFGYIDDPNAQVYNLGLIAPNVDAQTGSHVGSFAGWFGEGSVTNCYAKGGSISGNGYVGGLVGNHGAKYQSFYFPFSSISNCYSTTDVSGHYAVGGLAGYVRPGSRMYNCHATGDVYGIDKSGELGGLVGGSNYGEIYGCYATGNVSSGNESERLGGLLGSYVNGRISSCYATGWVSGGDDSRRLGGLVGDIFIGTVDNCYATGCVSGGADSQYLGGLVGFQASNGTLDSCYAIGSVHGGEGSEDIGGFVGYYTGSESYAIYGFTMKCFWDVQASGIQRSNGGMGLTTARMMNSETYSLNGWAGNPNWVVDSGKDYPRLVWEDTPGQTIPELVIDWFEGCGTQDEPYIIGNVDQLALIGTASVLWDKCFVLVSDLDLNDIDLSRIGICNGMDFNGYFDGKGHVIRNLTLGKSEISALYLGLFGLIGSRGRVSHLGLENVAVLGGKDSEYLGGLVGKNKGVITHCYTRGIVSGGDGSTSLGGLVGFNKGSVAHSFATVTVSGGDIIRFLGGLVGDNGGTITNCYANSNITGGYDSRCVGGLAGLSSGRITHCYAKGSVAGGNESRSIGGLIGAVLQGTVTQCYADAIVSGGIGSPIKGGLVGSYWEEAVINSCYFLAPSDGGGPDNGVGLPFTDEQMRQHASFVNWDFIGQADGPHDIWAMPVGGGYPILWWQLSPLPELTLLDGTGQYDDPYLISTAEEFNQIGHNPRLMESHFKLNNDIDLTGIEIFIIGSELYPFSGVFDGNDHTISNFNYTSTDAGGIGIFGYVKGCKAEIRDLGLIDPNVNAVTGSSVGSLVGSNGGAISNCYVQGARVMGYSGVGGLAGGNKSFPRCTGTIINCSADGSVSSISSAGGLLGYNYGTITDCYSICSVSGGGWIGGLVEYNFGKISRCYTKGSVLGDDTVGGLVGYNYNTITECFAATTVSGSLNVGGLTGINKGLISDCYTTGSVSGDNYVGGLVGYDAGMDYYYYYVPCEVVNCYSACSVTGSYNAGGLNGYSNSGDTVHNSFWDIETSGQATSTSGTGKTTAEMQMAGTFLEAGWDFMDETENGAEDIWWILEGEDYPRLVWELYED